jgi:hypothetical protein
MLCLQGEFAHKEDAFLQGHLFFFCIVVAEGVWGREEHGLYRVSLV